MYSGENGSTLRTLFPDDVKSFISEHKEGSYVLLDVRQPFEYEEQHLPGAISMPLPQLIDSLESLKWTKPIIVYCAVGGRSRMAAQYLLHSGITNVYHMEGGIEAWEERTASGPREFHLKYLPENATADSIIAVAYQMEEGLKKFHQMMRDRTTDPQLERLLDHLIKAEESHERSLLTLLSDTTLLNKLEANLEDETASGLMEGGIDYDEFMARNSPFLGTVPGYIDVAMMVETQALDLYLRMANESRDDNAKRVLFHIADEEKAHLQALARFLEGEQLPALLTKPF